MKRNTKSTRITAHLSENPSYFKWSVQRLCKKYGCSLQLMKKILSNLSFSRLSYLESLK